MNLAPVLCSAIGDENRKMLVLRPFLFITYFWLININQNRKREKRNMCLGGELNSRPHDLKTSALPTELKSQDRKNMKNSNFIHFFSTMVPFFVGTEGAWTKYASKRTIRTNLTI